MGLLVLSGTQPSLDFMVGLSFSLFTIMYSLSVLIGSGSRLGLGQQLGEAGAYLCRCHTENVPTE